MTNNHTQPKKSKSSDLTEFQKGLVWGWFTAALLLTILVATS